MINGKKIIALCTSRIFDHQHHSFLELLNRDLLQHNCRMMIFSLNSDLFWREDPDSPEVYVFDIIPFDRIECLIVMDEKIKCRKVTEKLISDAAAHSVPVIVVDGKYDGVTEISFDYEKGFENLVRHVIEGHNVKKPHFLAGIKGNKFSDMRIDTFKRVIEENGIAFNESMLSYGDFWSIPARNAAQALIDSGELPDAVICANDVMAVNVCDVFANAGVKVPDQVIVTGFDGIDEALLATPPLSTAGCDSVDLAEAVAKRAADILNGKTPQSTAIIPRLRPNTSCGCIYIPTDKNSKINDFNNRFYRYQDDIRILYDITTKMQMSATAEKAASFLDHYVSHDLCVITNTSCFEKGRNYFTLSEAGSGMTIFYDSYHPENCGEDIKPGELVPDLEKRLESGYPLIFNALDFMSKPFGYICFSFLTYDINEYARAVSITNTVNMGLGGYINTHYQKYLTDKITAELKVAAQMQESMLPGDFFSHNMYEIKASMMPAKNVGGDFYDFFQIDSRHLALVMADVSGKGVPAALFMATSKLVLHERALLPGTPAEILRDVNRHICENNKMGLFITIWFGILDLETGIITYSNAGHEYPAVKHGGGSYELVTSDNLPPVGTAEDIAYEDLTIDLSAGGSLFIYTDGVTDVKNEAGEHFGINRTLELLNDPACDSPDNVIKHINSGINHFVGETERFDDTTMMCIKFRGI